MRIFYSIPDIYPAFRVDISELFVKSLQDLGIQTTWLMENNKTAYVNQHVDYLGQPCLLPAKMPVKNTWSKLINKCIYWAVDLYEITWAANKNHDFLQVRDKYIVSIAGILVAKIFGKKFTYWCSYPFPEHYLELAKLTTGLKQQYYYWHGTMAKLTLYKVIMPLSDFVFVQTDYMKQDIARQGISEKKMLAVPMGVPKRLLDWAKSHPADIVAGRIVYTGIMTPERHLDMIIDAFALTKAQCANATLLMVGDGVHPSERAALEAQVTRLGLSSSVQFTGFVPIEQAWAYAASAAVCLSPVHPSPVLDCASPTKLYEYMALARPVVCNYHPEQTAVINASGAGLCVPWQAQAFSDAIVSLLNNPQQTELNAQNGPAWVAANRAYPIIAQTVFKQYQQLLSPIT